jgi:hypothetical protein
MRFGKCLYRPRCMNTRRVYMDWECIMVYWRGSTYYVAWF